MNHRRGSLLLPACFALTAASVSAAEEVVQLADFLVSAPPAAVEAPAGTFAQPVTALRHLGSVDVQARLFAEAQADVSIRGGTFMASGIVLGDTAVADPQTGHYLMELPVPASFLTAPEVVTGGALAASGAQATAGAVRHGWAPLNPGSRVELGGGSDGLLFGSARHGLTLSPGLAAEVELASAEGDGPRPGSDHDFKRAAARAVVTSPLGETTLVAGHQEKFFGWPYLYAPRELHVAIGSPGVESESITTDLALVEHRWRGADGASATVSVHGRRNRDDYELDRSRPGLFNAYRHRTESLGVSTRGEVPAGEVLLRLAAGSVAESITSTALTFAPYRSRTRGHASATAELGGELGDDRRWSFEAGFAGIDSNRTGGHLAPVVRAALEGPGAERAGDLGWRLFAGFAGSAQLPDFTAIGSNPNGGLFRGAPGLGLSRAEETELGVDLGARGAWRAGARVFQREDDDAVDWVFPVGAPPSAARFARAVDLTVRGAEVFGDWRPSPGVALGGSLAWLAKTNRSGFGVGEASFYGLNFPRWRATLGARWAITEALQVAVDHEARIQEHNPLRRGDRTAVMGSMSLAWRPRADLDWELTARVDNAYGEAFEEVPGVPGTPRALAVSTTFAW